MEGKQIVEYIKVREQWKDAIKTKNRAFSSIWRGLFKFSQFLVYYAVENYVFAEEIAQISARNPNYKYIFYLSLVFGCWGIIDSLLGIYSYFKSSQQVEQFERQVEQIEKELNN